MDRRVWLWAAAALALPTLAFAQEQGGGGEGVDWLQFGLTFLGGLILFLYGVSQLADRLKEAASDKLKRFIDKGADNRFTGLASGTFATFLLDSSSATIILLIALVDAGLVGFAQALPVILGSNIGTTLSSQIFASNVDQFAPVIMALGLALRLLAKREALKTAGAVLFALGLVLFALNLIGLAAEPLQ